MASLVPCTVCQRHVRRQDAQCPFCGAARSPSSGPFREVVLPRDATRATIFALGLSLAGQACGGRTDDDNDPSSPGSGASVGIGAGGSGNARGSTAGNAGRANSDVCQENPLASICSPTPPYGLSIRPTPEVGGSTGMPDATAPEAAEDAGTGDASTSDAGPDDGGAAL